MLQTQAISVAGVAMLTKMCNENDGAWAGMNQRFMMNPNRSRSAACGNYYAIDWWVLLYVLAQGASLRCSIPSPHSCQ
jgi:hypothetical protein